MMKIAFINETCGSGSTGRLTVELARELAARGHRCKIYYSHGQADFSQSETIGNQFDHRIHAMLSRITGLQGYFSKGATNRLLKSLSVEPPDIVHLNILHSNYINLKLLFGFLSRNKIPTVICLHDCWFYTGKCTHYVSAKCEKWLEQCGSCPLLHSDNVNPTFFFDRTKKCLKDKEKWYSTMDNLGVVGVSRWVSSEAERSILKKAKFTTIYNWIDFGIFYPRNASSLRNKFGLDNKCVLLMVATNIGKIKGYDVMLELASRLDENYKIVIIGKNHNKLFIPSNVMHIQHTSDTNELAEFYSLADICINTTLYETFGMVTAEAISCGTPVIVWDNTGSVELISEGCGLVVDQKSGIDGVIQAIRQIETWDKTNTLLRCIEWSNIMFNREKNIAMYEQFYEKLLNCV